MTTYFSRFLRNIKLTRNKEDSMVIQRLQPFIRNCCPFYFLNIFKKSLFIHLQCHLLSPRVSYSSPRVLCYYLILYIVYSFNTCELSVWHVSGTESGQEGRLREKQKKKKKKKTRVPGVGLDCTASRPQTQLLDKVKGDMFCWNPSLSLHHL